jgi:hypothetical protein
MTKYETGRWHNWLGGEIPFDLETTNYYIATMDTSKDHFYERGMRKPIMGINVYHRDECPGNWYPRGEAHSVVVAFYVVSYESAKEMTVAEVEQELGYRVKIVK